MDRRPVEELCRMRGVHRQSIEDMLNSMREESERIRIRNLSHYVNSLTHRSALREFTSVKGSNERLELLGDCVLNLIVTDLLYRMYPREDEGFLTRVRTKLVRGQSLCTWAKLHNMDTMILMNTKALDNSWNTNTKKLEDTFEAVLGALYLDIGMATCRDFVENIIRKTTNFDEIILDDNYKDILMRKMQTIHSDMVANNMHKSQYGTEIMPLYTIVDTSGEDHQKVFHVQVSIEGRVLGSGSANQKRQAEQLAAKQALDLVGY